MEELIIELNYNPYLRQAHVKFDGMEPNRNSQVMKYYNSPFTEWIDLIPDIFHDEMNGFDFRLDFSGTEADFNDLVSVFRNRGITSEEVDLFMKNELASRSDKQKSVDQLLHWLEMNPNSRFDFHKFKEEHEDLFWGKYPYLVLNGKSIDTSCFINTEISVEFISSVNDLRNTDLKDVPVLVYVDNVLYPELHSVIVALEKHKEFRHDQVFFLVDGGLNISSVKRVVSDLGILKPNMVLSPDAPVILKYIDAFPVSDYLYDCISALDTSVTGIKEKLESDVMVAKEKNTEVYAQLKTIDNTIERIRQSMFAFSDCEHYVKPPLFEVHKVALQNCIKSWKLRKTKITDDSEVRQYSDEYKKYLDNHYYRYISLMKSTFSSCREKISTDFFNRFHEKLPEFSISPLVLIDEPTPDILDFHDSFLSIKRNESNVFVNHGINMKRTSEQADKNCSPEMAYYLNEWREYALRYISELATAYEEKLYDTLCWNYNETAKAYQRFLEGALKDQTTKRDSLIGRLSDSDRQMQLDREWVSEFLDKLTNLKYR